MSGDSDHEKSEKLIQNDNSIMGVCGL